MKALCLLLLVLSAPGDATDGGLNAPCRTDAQCGPGFRCAIRRHPDAPSDYTCAPGCNPRGSKSPDHQNCPSNATCTEDVRGFSWRCRDNTSGRWTDNGAESHRP